MTDCPHIRASDEGTSYCALAEKGVRELEAEAAQWQESCGRNYVRATEAEMRREELEREVERLTHDIERHIRIASAAEAEVERLRDVLEECDTALKMIAGHLSPYQPNIDKAARHALARMRAVLEQPNSASDAFPQASRDESR